MNRYTVASFIIFALSGCASREAQKTHGNDVSGESRVSSESHRQITKVERYQQSSQQKDPLIFRDINALNSTEQIDGSDISRADSPDSEPH